MAFTETAPKRSLFGRFLGHIRRHRAFTALCVLAAVAVLVYIISRFSQPFAEFCARYPGQAVRWLLAKITSVLPFSAAETLIVAIPVIFAAVIYFSVRLSKTHKDWFARMMRAVVSAALVIVITFGVGFGPCYFRNPLARNIGLVDSPVSAQALYDTGAWLSAKIEELLPQIVFGEGGESHMTVSFYTLADQVNEAFGKYAKDKDFISHFYSKVKPVSLSRYMTYTHISGVYSFFTGEANVNFNYPDFVIPYTIAHEMAHQRGVAREDEANFTAFLVCTASDDPYIRYSGYVEVLREILSALYKADKEKYSDLIKTRYPSRVASEMSAYSRFFEPYRESTASKVVSATNDTYLRSQAVQAGERSYGLVTDLAVAYYLTYVKEE